MTPSEPPSFTGCTVLVVGGAGFVGSNLSHDLLRKGVTRLLILDNFMSSEPSNVPDDPRVQFIYGSASDPRVLNEIPSDLDYAWHLACYHGNQASIADPFEDHANNALPSLTLFDFLANQTSAKKVVYSAAGCAVAEKTYGHASATTEDAPVSLFQDSPYSISKIIGELYGNYYFLQTGFPFVRARFQNVYGPREILGAGRWRKTPATVWRNVTPTLIWRALSGLPLHLDNDGLASRDFIYVDDIVNGLETLALQGTPGEAYNLATGVETTIAQLASLILTETQSSSALILQPARDWDRSGNRFGSTKKSESELGFKAQTPLVDGIRRTVGWTIENRAEIQSCISRYTALSKLP
jgi:UDP-glucose 4-epimerase